MKARCLRCRAGNEWIEGKATIKAPALTRGKAREALSRALRISYNEDVPLGERLRIVRDNVNFVLKSL